MSRKRILLVSDCQANIDRFKQYFSPAIEVWNVATQAEASRLLASMHPLAVLVEINTSYSSPIKGKPSVPWIPYHKQDDLLVLVKILNLLFDHQPFLQSLSFELIYRAIVNENQSEWTQTDPHLKTLIGAYHSKLKHKQFTEIRYLLRFIHKESDIQCYLLLLGHLIQILEKSPPEA